MNQDIGVYFSRGSEPVFRFHLDRIVSPWIQPWAYFDNISSFSQSSAKHKIAFLQIPYPWSENFLDTFNSIYKIADSIVIFATELHRNTVDFIKSNDRKKINYFICGYLNDELESAKCFRFMDWFRTSAYFYKNIKPSLLYNLTPYIPKIKMFDALLGRKKLHRTHAYNYILNNNLLSSSITTYNDDIGPVDFYSNDNAKWVWEDGITYDKKISWTVEMVKYYDYPIRLSQVIPIGIYNQTAYSLIAETNFENDYVFFTEKTVKPILGRRLFITLSHKHALKKLRDLGFKTFHGIIDETYDNIDDVITRHTMALDQLKWLCQQDQYNILMQIQDICNHNYDLMISRDWYDDINDPLIKIIFSR